MSGDVSATFSDVVADLDPPMAVVTTIAGGERAGCLVGFHAQSSIDPARYAVWLSKANHTCRVALRAETLAVHLLDRSQRGLAELFGANSGDDIDKFGRCAWSPGRDGVPLLDECRHRFVGRRVALLDEGGDHVCVVLEPVDASADGSLVPLRLAAVVDIEPGHHTEERPSPPTERATTSSGPLASGRDPG